MKGISYEEGEEEAAAGVEHLLQEAEAEVAGGGGAAGEEHGEEGAGEGGGGDVRALGARHELGEGEGLELREEVGGRWAGDDSALDAFWWGAE